MDPDPGSALEKMNPDLCGQSRFYSFFYLKMFLRNMQPIFKQAYVKLLL